jgi:hypothetical protein
MNARRDICIGECEFGQTDGIDHVACERMCDARGRPVPCMLKIALRDPKARCPHPDEAFAKRWNNAPVYVAPGCGGSPSAPPLSRSQVDGFLTLRVRECKGHGKEKDRCPHAGPGWFCLLEGRSIRAELRDSNYACKDGRFAAVARGKEGLPS